MQKQILTQLIAILLCVGVYAQSPNKFPFQGVAKANNGAVLINTTINTLKVTLRTGEMEYVESYNNIETDANGMFFLNVGDGQVISGNFNDLEWGKHAAVINLEVDGQTTLDTQLLSVPYAMHANSSNVATTNSVLDVSNFGIVADMDETNDQTIKIIQAIENAGSQYIKQNGEYKSVEIRINKGVRYDYKDLLNYLNDEQQNFTDYVIHDNSGWDEYNLHFNGSIRKITQTKGPEQKNAHEFEFIADYHPAFVVNNNGSGNKRASVVWRIGDKSLWTAGTGYKPGRLDFRLSTPNTVRLLVDKEGRFGFNFDYESIKSDSETDATFSFYPKENESDNDIKLIARENGAVNLEFASHVSSSFLTNASLKVDSDGNVKFTNNNVKADFYMNYDLHGYKDKVNNRTEFENHYIREDESQKVFTNEGSRNNFAFKLPKAVKGLKYRFVVVASNVLGVLPTGQDVIRCINNGQYISSNKKGASIELFCVVDGIWEIGYNYGKWTSYKTLNGDVSGDQYPISVIFEDCSN